jgi:RNA polymerase sigma factor for flagellar operon FliA
MSSVLSVSIETITPHDRIVGSLTFVESVARRVAATMPHTIDLGDLVQDGMVGLIDAAHRFDEGRGIKFETFAERRVRGAMIDALRKDAWPRGVRRQRRELEAAREALRRETGVEPSLADLAARVGTDEARLGRTIVRINTIESTSVLTAGDGASDVMLPDVCLPPETPSPDRVYEDVESRSRVRQAIAGLPPRERKVIALYYFKDVTMKQIGAAIGVNESRVSQLHARAIQRLQKSLGAHGTATTSLALFQAAKARQAARQADQSGLFPAARPQGVVVPYPTTSRTVRSRSDSRNGLGSHRQPVSSRNRSASVPTTSPVTKITRRASAGELAAIAR